MPQEVKSLIEELGRTFGEFKSENDARLKQLEEKGQTDPLLEEKINKMNEALSDLQSQKDKMEAALRRAAMENERKSVDLKTKAKKFTETISKHRGRVVEMDEKGYVAYTKAFEKYFRYGRDELSSDEAKALSVGSDADGGFFVTPDMSGAIVEKIFETSPMRQVASVQAINSASLEGLYDLDEAASGWVAEQGARPSTNTPKLGAWEIQTHEQYAMPEATQKMLDDSSVNIEQWLARKVESRFARTENTAFVNGDGVGKPRGFLTYANGTTLPGTIERVKTGANGAFAGGGAGGDVFFDAIYSLKAPYRSNARWSMNRLTQAAIRKLKDSNGEYIWQAGLAAGQPATLAGYPIIEMDDMPDIATGSLSIGFGDFRGYQIVDRLGIRVLRDPYSNKPYVQFYTVKRTGGDVIDFDAIKLIEFSA